MISPCRSCSCSLVVPALVWIAASAPSMPGMLCVHFSTPPLFSLAHVRASPGPVVGSGGGCGGAFFCFCFEGAARGVVGVFDALAVLFLCGELAIDVVRAGQRVFTGICGREFCRVAEGFVCCARVVEAVRGVVGVGFGCSAFGGAVSVADSRDVSLVRSDSSL